jgi:hypothetical protein
VNQRRRTQLAGAAIGRKGKGRVLLGHGGRHGLLNEHTAWQPPKCRRPDIGVEHHQIFKKNYNEKETNDCENTRGRARAIGMPSILPQKNIPTRVLEAQLP